MDIGSAIALFLFLSMFLLSLFCLVTKYLHNRLKRNILEKHQAYLIEEQLYDSTQEDVDFDRNNLNMKYGSIKNRSGSKKYLEMDEIDSYKSCLKGNDDQIYKPNALRNKLSTSTLRVDSKQQTTRSIVSQKSFRPQKITTQRGNNKANWTIQDLINHKYISKLIKYDISGLTIWDVTLKMIRKTINGDIKQSKKVNVNALIATDQTFKTELENLGIQYGSFGCFIQESAVQFMNSKDQTVYRADELKISQCRKEISEYQYEKYKHQVKIACSVQ